MRWRPACRRRTKALSRSLRPVSTRSSSPLDRLGPAAALRWTAVGSATALLMPRSTEPARSNAMRRWAASRVIGIAPRRWRRLCPTRHLVSRRDRGRCRCESQRRTAEILPSMAATTGEHAKSQWASDSLPLPPRLIEPTKQLLWQYRSGSFGQHALS